MSPLSIELSEIFEATCSAAGITRDELLGPGRSRPEAWARFIAARMIHQLYPCWPLVRISVALGRTDPSTTLYALRQDLDLGQYDATYRALSQQAETTLRACKSN